MNSNCALITGSSDGLGMAMALRFASQGWGVIVHGRDKDKVAAVGQEVARLGGRDFRVVGDITDPSTIMMLASAASVNKANLLINNVGIYTQRGIDSLKPGQVRYVFEVNLIAPVLLTKEVFEVFKISGSGMIININSVAGKVASPNEAIYCAGKHGLRGFMSSFKHEALKHNVSVLDIYFGAINTKMAEGRKDADKFISKEEAAELVLSLMGNYRTLRVSEIEVLRKIY